MASLVQVLWGLDIVSREPHRPSGWYGAISCPDCSQLNLKPSLRERLGTYGCDWAEPQPHSGSVCAALTYQRGPQPVYGTYARWTSQPTRHSTTRTEHDISNGLSRMRRPVMGERAWARAITTSRRYPPPSSPLGLALLKRPFVLRSALHLGEMKDDKTKS